MTQNEIEVLFLMESTKNKYFKDIQMPITFHILKEDSSYSIRGRILYLSGGVAELWLYYNDDTVLEHRYRWGLVPIIAHELSHIINPVSPDDVMAERLPEKIVQIWQEMKDSGSVEIDCKFMED